MEKPGKSQKKLKQNVKLNTKCNLNAIIFLKLKYILFLIYIQRKTFELF